MAKKPEFKACKGCEEYWHQDEKFNCYEFCEKVEEI